jgi:hypothetical protein
MSEANIIKTKLPIADLFIIISIPGKDGNKQPTIIESYPTIDPDNSDYNSIVTSVKRNLDLHAVYN